jgi:hypothetical protein
MRHSAKPTFRDSERTAITDRGMALITALLILSFLTVVGGAMLSSSRIDVLIADNYRTNIQLQFLAEAGIEAEREALRASSNDLSDDLDTFAGVDNTLSTSLDLTTLLASDDRTARPSDTGLRTSGQTLTDTLGRTLGTYHVFVRNDVADGLSSTTDTNDVVTLVSIARIGDATKTIEAVVRKAGFPPLPGALTLDGDVGLFDAANSNLFQIDGNDQGGSGNDEHAIAVTSGADVTEVLDEIPDNREDNYPGAGNALPPPADVADVSGTMSSELLTVSGLESIVDSLAGAATDHYTPAFGTEASIGSIGGANDYRIVVVDGDCEFGPGTGYGFLVVRGVLTVSGIFTWNGPILVVGQGELHWNGGGTGEVQGGVFIAKTRNDDEDATNPYGTVASSLGSVIADFNGGGGNGILYNTQTIANAKGLLPYVPIAIREY